VHDEHRQRLGSDAERKDIGSDAEERVALDEDLPLDAEQSERVKGGNEDGVAGSADGGVWDDGSDWGP
jgi:hypothetical protein